MSHLDQYELYLYKICYHGKIWGERICFGFQTFCISASQAALHSLSHKATMFTVYVVLWTQLWNEKVSLMVGVVKNTWQYQRTLPACLNHTNPHWIYTHHKVYSMCCCKSCKPQVKAAECWCDTMAFSHECDACEVPVVHRNPCWHPGVAHQASSGVVMHRSPSTSDGQVLTWN